MSDVKIKQTKSNESETTVKLRRHTQKQIMRNKCWLTKPTIGVADVQKSKCIVP